MKLYTLAINGDDGTVYLNHFKNKRDREMFTRNELYGNTAILGLDKEQREAWTYEKEILEQEGILSFEGDCPIEWFITSENTTHE